MEVLMLRSALLIAIATVLAIPTAVQVQSGFKVRADGHAASAVEGHAALKFSPMGKGFQIAGAAPGAIIWNPASTVKGIYAVRGTFTLVKPSATITDYGLIFGGRDLEGTPDYVYFTIAQDGAFQVRHRLGNEIHEIDRSLHFMIRKPDANGKSTNTLEVQIAPTAVSYLINGAVVHATPTRPGTNSYTEGEKVNGAAGVRVDGPIEVQVDALEVIQPFTPPVRGQ
jgi:hypothetical protein